MGAGGLILDGPLAAALHAVAEVLRGAAEPWWIIGSAALALHGVAGIVVRDVDVLMGETDLAGLVARLDLVVGAEGDPLFLSNLFATWRGQPMRIEFMAGLHVRGELVVPATRLATGGSPRVFVPSLDEMGAILRRFGRTQDLERARLIAVQSGAA